MIIVVMGVTGTGKSTIGRLLADRLPAAFIDADDYHSLSSIEKMKSGISLNDEDRYPWLHTLSGLLKSVPVSKDVVMACSALKEEYRKILQQEVEEKITWIYLDGPKEILKNRIKNREGHFMPEVLLESQLETLEIPEYAFSFSVEKDPATIVNNIMEVLR